MYPRRTNDELHAIQELTQDPLFFILRDLSLIDSENPTNSSHSMKDQVIQYPVTDDMVLDFLRHLGAVDRANIATFIRDQSVACNALFTIANQRLATASWQPWYAVFALLTPDTTKLDFNKLRECIDYLKSLQPRMATSILDSLNFILNFGESRELVVRELENYKKCYINLSGISFNGDGSFAELKVNSMLNYSDLRGVRIDGADISKFESARFLNPCCLTGANLSHAHLSNLILESNRAIAFEINISNAIFENVTFRANYLECSFKGALFLACVFGFDVKFNSCDLTNTTFCFTNNGHGLNSCDEGSRFDNLAVIHSRQKKFKTPYGFMENIIPINSISEITITESHDKLPSLTPRQFEILLDHAHTNKIDAKIIYTALLKLFDNESSCKVKLALAQIAAFHPLFHEGVVDRLFGSHVKLMRVNLLQKIEEFSREMAASPNQVMSTL